MPNFSSKFAKQLGLQKPPAVCHKPPPPPFPPTGCPNDIGDRIDWWCDVHLETPNWPDYYKVTVTDRKFGPVQQYTGSKTKSIDHDGPDRLVNTIVSFQYFPATCDWNLRLAFFDDHVNAVGNAEIFLPLLDTLPMIIHTTLEIGFQLGGHVELIGMVVPDVL